MKLRLINGEDKDREWQLTGPRMLLGRDPICDVVLDDLKLSRIHAEITHEGDILIFHDKNSMNGSYVNDYRVTRQILMPGDMIRIGTTELRVFDDDLTQTVKWQEGDSLITSKAPLDLLSHQIEEFGSSPDTYPEQIEVTGTDQQAHLTRKLIKSLETIYEVGNAISSILSVDDLLACISDKLLDVFPDIQSICILLQDRGNHYVPRFIKRRVSTSTTQFRISRSVLNKSIDEKVCILANDASHDQRFSAADSIITMNVRSVMCAPLVNKGNVLGAIYLDNRDKPSCFDEHDTALLSALATQSAIAIENSKLYENVQKAYHESILALINTMEAKDPYTMGHTQRTSRYAIGIAQELGMNEEQIKKLKTAAELHDIGKIGVSERIIDKEGSLSTTEYRSVQAHVITGEKILQPIEYLKFVLPIVRHHHEHFDGSGYPDGLKGEEIPLEARIIGVVDAFDAMTTKRPYNQPLPFKDALEKCIVLKGIQFDPEIVDALVKCITQNYSFPLNPGETSSDNATVAEEDETAVMKN